MGNYNANYEELVPEKIFRFRREHDFQLNTPIEIYESLNGYGRGCAGYLRHDDLVCVLERCYKPQSHIGTYLKIIVVGTGIIGYVNYLGGVWEEVHSA